jgi:molecular chaperone DnaJ
MSKFDPYEILDISTASTLTEIKQAYRRLVKQFHPDSQHELANHEQIAQVNAAYALLKDPKRRQVYDNNRSSSGGIATAVDPIRRRRAQDSQDRYRHDRKVRHEADLHLNDWIKRVYTPVNRELTKIIKPLRAEITALAADPFDDELMSAFQLYLEDSHRSLEKAHRFSAQCRTLQMWLGLPRISTIVLIIWRTVFRSLSVLPNAMTMVI